MAEMFQVLDDHFRIVLTLSIAGLFALSGLCKTIMSITRTSARERTRREIAAYVAEGTITPEQAERLLKAEVNTGRGEHV